jgi:hypothetical protein
LGTALRPNHRSVRATGTGPGSAVIFDVDDPELNRADPLGSLD